MTTNKKPAAAPEKTAATTPEAERPTTYALPDLERHQHHLCHLAGELLTETATPQHLQLARELLEESRPLTIYARLAAITRDLGPISKSRRNQEFNYSYRGIDDILNHLNPLLAQHGVVVTVHLLEERAEARTSARGTALRFLRNLYAVRFTAVDGSSHAVQVVGEAIDSQDKATNKANTAALKLALIQTFAIATDDVKDTEAENHDLAPAPRREAPARPAPSAGERHLSEELNQPAPAPVAKPPATADEVQRCAAAIDRMQTEEPLDQLRHARTLTKDQNTFLLKVLDTALKLGPHGAEVPGPAPAQEAEPTDDRPPLPPQRRAAGKGGTF